MNKTADLFEARPPPRASAVVPQRRKLHTGHFAFMRALVQGLDVAQSWQRYLRLEGEASDKRTVRATIAWMRDEFAAAARREARFGTARLVLLDTGRLTDEAGPPSLDDFAAERELGEFSQAEQLALYEAEFGRASRHQRRRNRLIARQLQALHWLEQRVAEPPRAADPIAAWLNPQLVTPLAAAGIQTLTQLAERINGRGAHWHRGVRGLGAVKSQRITDWLLAHETTTGLRLGAHAAQVARTLPAAQRATIVAPATAVRTLEKFIVPPTLDGRAGTGRRAQAECRIAATTDRTALDAWLATKQGLHTRRAYRREAERFLLWCVLQRGRALSSIEPADCAAYRAFIADPQPAEHWCAPRSVGRWSPAWRPFEGPLSPAAQRQAVIILKNLYGFLVDTGYLSGNPWTMPATGEAAVVVRAKLDARRSFSESEWAWLLACCARRPDSAANRRLALAIRLLYGTGLRLAEAVAAKLADLQPLPAGAGLPAGALLHVAGPRARVLPLPPDVLEALQRHLQSRDLALMAAPTPADARTHLLGRASDAHETAPNLPRPAEYDAHAGIAPATLYGQLKRFFIEAAAALRDAGDAAGAAHLARASTHWLRHTHARHAIARGLPVELAQQQLGHASLATTAAYTTPDLARRLAAFQQLWAHTTSVAGAILPQADAAPSSAPAESSR